MPTKRAKPPSDKKALEALNARWGAMATAGDLEGVVDMYAADGSLVWPDQKAVHGTAGIRKAWKGFLVPPGLWIKFTPTTVTFSSDKKLAVDFGVVQMRMPPTAPMQVAKYLVVWKKVRGQWKVLYDSWNSNTPAPPPA